MGSPAPVPWQTPVIQLDPQTSKPLPGFTMGKEWGNWLFTSVVQQIANAPSILPAVSLTGQSASIATTPIPLPSLATGAYRLSYYAEITTAAVTSSSLTIAVTFTHNSKTLTFTGAAMTGNTTTTIQTNIWTFLIDAASPVSYTVTYASNGAAEMKYQLYMLLEAV